MIGTRHGEKLYETLATREELVRSVDQGDYYRVPVDARDLNYGAYYDEGDVEESHTDDYHSHNTERLDVDQVVALLRAFRTSRSWSGLHPMVAFLVALGVGLVATGIASRCCLAPA